MKTKRAIQLALVLSLCMGAALAASQQWLHVRVETPKKGGETVSVNVPLALAETVLPMIKEKELSEGRIRIEEKDLTVQDLRKIWQTVREQGDAEYVSVKSSDISLRVAIEGQYLIVKTDETSPTQVQISLPTQVVDALLSGTGNELDLLAAVHALEATGSREIVSIQDKDAQVKVWIDEQNVTK
jgi:hypothetical protein